MKATLWVMLGSALGGAARFWCVELATMAFGGGFPWGTLGVNILGSLAAGAAAGALAGGLLDQTHFVRQFFIIGFCGGFTTFSAFSLQTLELAQFGSGLRAVLYVLASVMLCLIAVAAGWWGVAGLRAQ